VFWLELDENTARNKLFDKLFDIRRLYVLSPERLKHKIKIKKQKTVLQTKIRFQITI